MPLSPATISRRILDGLYRGSAILAALCLAAIAVLIFVQILGRWFGVLVPSVEDFAGYLMAAATFLALACTLRTGGHIRVNLLIRNLSPRFRRVQETVVLTLVLALVVHMAVACMKLVIESHAFNDVSGGYVAVPLWMPQLPMAAGLVILAVALLDSLIGVVTGNPPRFSEHGQPEY